MGSGSSPRVSGSAALGKAEGNILASSQVRLLLLAGGPALRTGLQEHGFQSSRRLSCLE